MAKKAKNPQDTTLRNNRARQREIREIKDRAIETRSHVLTLRNQVMDLTTRVTALESRTTPYAARKRATR